MKNGFGESVGKSSIIIKYKRLVTFLSGRIYKGGTLG